MASAKWRQWSQTASERWEQFVDWPHWPKVNALALWLSVSALLVVGLWALLEIPQWQVNQFPELAIQDNPLRRFELENEARRTLAQIVIGIFGLLALFVAWRRVQAADRQVELGREAQFTERFTRAIDQLGATDDDGAPRLEIRLGGIYALERLARDSEKDHWTIMEVLTAYVRENAPWRGESQSEPKPNNSSEAPDQPEASEKAPSPPPAPRIDIQAILTVVGRRERSRKRERDRWLDLRGSDLRGADLIEAHLEGASLFQAQLEGAFFVAAHLEGAILAGGHLKGAHLNNAHLEGAKLNEAHLEGAFLFRAQLEGAMLDNAHLEGAFLLDAHLEGANLSGARLQGADLYGADLTGAYFLTQEQINQAHGDENTKLPVGLKRPAHWKQSE